MNLELAEILLLHKVFIIIVRLSLLEEFAVTTLKDPLQLLGLLPACAWVAWHLLMMDCIWWLKVTLLDIQGHWPPLAGTAMIEMEGQEYIVIDIEHWLMRLVSMINLTLRYLWHLLSRALFLWVMIGNAHAMFIFLPCLHYCYITLIEICGELANFIGMLVSINPSWSGLVINLVLARL